MLLRNEHLSDITLRKASFLLKYIADQLRNSRYCNTMRVEVVRY